jgi:tetratricopeptide (TPR) repeat protein
LLLLGATALIVAVAPSWGPWLAAQYHLYRGRTALQFYQTDAGCVWLSGAERFDPDNAETQFLLGRACRRQRRYDEAAQHLERAAKLGFPGLRVERERRLAVAQTGRVRDVGDYLAEMLASPGDDGAEICAAYVQGYCLTLDFGTADKILDAWIADFPDDPEAHVYRGNFWYGQNEWTSAIPAYEKCLKLDPSRHRARLSLAECLLKMNESAKAEPHFRRCLKDAPDELQIWFGLGKCLKNLGRPDEARTAFEHIVERAPRHGEVRMQLAEIEYLAGRPEAAIKWAEPVAEDWPDDILLATLMAQAWQQVGNPENARKYWGVVRRGEAVRASLDKLASEVSEHPSDPDLRYRIGTMYLRYRSREEGVYWMNSVLQYDPRHQAAHRALADYYSKVGESGRAGQHLRVAEEAEATSGS